MSAKAHSGLIFDWPRREGFPFVLFGCVFLSALAHMATFFVFQVVYPQRVTIPPPAPQISLMTASSPEGEALLRWVAAEDPALVASASSVMPPGVLDVRYRPRYEIARTQPRGSVESALPIEFPPARNPLEMILSAGQRAEAQPAPGAVPSTRVTFSPALAGRLNSEPALTWKVRASAPVEAMRSLIGVNDRGDVRYAFLQKSCGLPQLDAEALAQLQRLSFAPSGATITWAFATVTFGADAYADLSQAAVRIPPSK